MLNYSPLFNRSCSHVYFYLELPFYSYLHSRFLCILQNSYVVISSGKFSLTSSGRISCPSFIQNVIQISVILLIIQYWFLKFPCLEVSRNVSSSFLNLQPCIGAVYSGWMNECMLLVYTGSHLVLIFQANETASSLWGREDFWLIFIILKIMAGIQYSMEKYLMNKNNQLPHPPSVSFHAS